MEDISRYLRGEALYGDDFDAKQVAEWYADEEEGYANLVGAKDATSHAYGYHAWNQHHAFRHLPDREFSHVMGFGSAYGEELLPVLGRARQVTIVDPSSAFVQDSIHGLPVSYVKPAADGRLPMADATFDLITCFGVLHHIPNVSFVVSELARVLKPDGCLLVREPIVSMGDWRYPRPGGTKRERGIPLPIFRNIIAGASLKVQASSLCGFPLTTRLFRYVRADVNNSTLATKIDALACRLLTFNVNYHPTSFLDKFRPTSAYFVLQRTV